MAEFSPTQQETTLRDFLNVVFRRKWIIIAIVGLASVLVVYFNARKPVLYESSSRTLVKRGEQSDIRHAVRYLGWVEEVSSQIQVILSEDVFAGARSIFEDSVKARGLPADWVFLPGAVRADVVGESNVFLIRYSGFHPGICKLGCHAMTLSFQEYYRERKTPPALTDFFAQEIADVRSDLEHWEAKRHEFINDQKYFGFVEESRFLLSRTYDLENNLRDLNNEIVEQELEVNNLRPLLNSTGSELEGELAFVTFTRLSDVIRNIKFTIQRLNITREELSHKYTDKHPEIIAIDQQLTGLRADLKREVENTYRLEEQTLQAMYTNKSTLTDELNRVQAKLDGLPDKEKALSQIDKKIEALQARYELLLANEGESQIALASRPEWEVTILSNASNAQAKKTKDYVRIALGPLLSLIVGLGLAFFLESLDHTVNNMAEAEQYLGRPVIATISDIRK